MDSNIEKNNALLGVIVTVLAVLLILLLTYLIFFLPKNGDEKVVNNDTNNNQVVDDTNKNDNTVVDDSTSSDDQSKVEEDSVATDLEESEIQVVYKGDSSLAGYVYFENSSGKKYFMNGLSLTSDDVNKNFVIKADKTEDVTDGVKVTGKVMYYKILTYGGNGEDISDDYSDYVYFEINGVSSTEVYFLRDFNIVFTEGKDYEFLFERLESLDSAAGTSYWKMNGKFEYSTI